MALFSRRQKLKRRTEIDESRSDAGAAIPDETIDQLQLERARTGDQAVWDEWFRKYYPAIVQYAHIRVRRRADAEDVASRVFVNALRGIKSYEYRGRPLLAWLYRIAHNIIQDDLRSAERSPEPDATPQETDPSALIENIDLLNAVDALGEDQREVVILRFFIGMPAQQVADFMGKSPAAVYSLQARALLQLRDKLGSDFLE